MICAFSVLDQEACKGDSGGPLIRPFSRGGDLSMGQPSLDIAVGITSFREIDSKCGTSDLPNVFTRMSSFRDWIDEKISGSEMNSQTPAPVFPANPPLQPASTMPSPTPPTPTPRAALPPEPSSSADPPASAPSLDSGRPLLRSPAEQEELDVSLWNASRDGNVIAVEEAINEGANMEVRVGRSGYTPLIVASVRGHLVIVNVLLLAGAEKDGRSRFGETAIYTVSASGPTDVALALIEAGVDVDIAESGGWTPLNIAVKAGRAPIARALIKANADPNKGNWRGDTPLHMVSFSSVGPEDPIFIARDLLDAGSNLEARDNLGWTPLMWASHFGHAGILQLLLDEGANPDVRGNEGRTVDGIICACQDDIPGAYNCIRGPCKEPGVVEEIKDILG
eukprot:evm.model.scf_15EXC.6 EVM.evm.TU.scf_15EXC.6   scf_15EXC:113569-121577(+)